MKCSSYTFKERGEEVQTDFVGAAELFATLPATVLSSDESGHEDGIVFIRKAPWRSSRFTQLIETLTTYEEFTRQASSLKKSGGNRGYTRTRFHNRRVQPSTTVPRQLSSSLYDHVWYSKLPFDKQGDLGVRHVVSVPTIVSVHVNSAIFAF
jgi:hypothetical protein